MPLTLDQMATTKKSLDEMAEQPKQVSSEFLEPVFNREKEIGDFLPLEERENFGKIMDLSDKPDQEKEDLTNTAYFANEFIADPDDVSNFLPDIIEKTKFNPAKAKPEERGFFGKVSESWRRGDATVMADIAVYETAFEGKGDENEVLAALKKLQLEQILDPIEGTFLADLVYSGVEIIPAMARGYWSAIPDAFTGMAVGALVGLAAGQIPPLTISPIEDVPLATLGAKLGLRAGFMSGSAMFWYKQGAGSMYASMREKDYDPELSKHVAGVAAIPYAIVEFLQVSRLTPGLRQGALKVAQKSMLGVLGSAAKKYGTVWSEEVFEEVVQEIIQVIAEDTAGFLSDELKLPKGVGEFLLERGRRLWETTKAAGKAMALLPIPGAAIDIYTGKRSIIKPVKPTPEAPSAAPEAEVPAEGIKPPLKPTEAVAEGKKPVAGIEKEMAEKIPETVRKAIQRKAFPPITEKVQPVSPKMTVGEVIAEAVAEIKPVEPTEIITEPEKGEIAGVPFSTVLQGQKLYKTEKIARTAQGYENKIAKLKTQIEVAKVKGKARLSFELGKQKTQLARKLEQTRTQYEKIISHIKAVVARRKEVKMLRDKVVKLAKKIAKPPSPSIDFFYREAIEQLQAGIDPRFRAEKTVRMRERTREFLKRKPEALKDMPVKLLKTINKKAINDYTIEELEQIAGEIDRLKKQGKLKRKLKLIQKTRRLEETTGQIVETITKGEPIKSEEEPVVYSTTKEGFIKTAFEKTKAWTWRPSRIFDMLDGMKQFAGEAHRLFIDKVNQATNAKLRIEDKRKDAGKAKMKELDIDFKDLTQTRTIKGIQYTIDEMIGVYNANKNRLAKLAIMYGNNINEETIAKIIANLTESEKAWGDYIVQDYDENYERLRNEVIKVENRDMGYEENYTPIRRTEIDYTTHTEEIVDAILRKEALRKAYAEHGFTIKRKEVPAEFQKPIRLNATSIWLGQVSKQEQYIHLADLVKDMHKIAGSKEFRAAVEQQFGKEFNKVIRNYIDRVANPNIYKSYNALENLSRRLRQNAVIAYLAYNFVTMGKQIPSVFLYLQDAGPTHLIGSAMEFIEHPIKMIRMVREKDPQVKHRAIERELEELKAKQPDLYNEMINKFGRAGMEGIYLFDAIARTIGWNAVYQKALHNGVSEAEAVRLAQNATLRTQPAAAAKDVAQLYATSEFANWFTMFTNQLNQIYNIATYDFSGYVKNKDYQKATLSSIGLGITALTIWIITKRRLPESPEDFADAAAEQAINAVPLVGKAIMAGRRGWGGTEIPAFELPKAAGRAADKIVKGKFNDKDLKAIAEGVAVTAGVPYVGPKRVIKMITTGEVKELIGGEPIGAKKHVPELVSD